LAYILQASELKSYALAKARLFTVTNCGTVSVSAQLNMATLIVRLGIRRVLWIFLLCSVAACAAIWVGSIESAQARMEQMVKNEQEQSQAQAVLASANLNQRLAQAQSAAATLAQDETIQKILNRFGPYIQPSQLPLKERGNQWRDDPLLQPMSQRMQRLVDKFDFHTLWVTNAAGDTIAEGHDSRLDRIIGINYADRGYFKSTQQGLDGRQFIVGRVTSVYSTIFSSPVLANGQFFGMVGVSLSMQKLGSSIAQLNAVVTDDLGVIVLAQDPALLMQTMPGATVNTLTNLEREQRYKRSQFESVGLSPVRDEQRPYPWLYRGQPYVMGSHPTSDGALHTYVLRDIGASLGSIKRDQLWWFAVVSALALLSAAMATGVALYVIRTKQQQTALLTLNHELDLQANTDVLTGCANRRHFIHALEQEINRSDRYKMDFCLLSTDIDHFKQVNDTYGHAAGDEVLKHFVATVQRNLREPDLIGRLGGEEFSILLPNTSAEGGAMMAERIRSAVEASPALFGTTCIAVTVSIGGIQSQPGILHGLGVLLAHADKVLYAAKQGGRNRVAWDQLPTHLASPKQPPAPTPQQDNI
jgi:diguanylate cyclase (GGDEF)-like protein